MFVDEQAIPREDEFDSHDAACIHVLIYDPHQAVATGRVDLAQAGKIGRIAVLREHRGKGVGSLVMNVLEAAATNNGVAKTWLHAQARVAAFYESLGYVARGENFVEDGITHVLMEKNLIGIA